ncbi:MAG: hypothetical protein DRQ44_06225 [Gammaproteobacteria bacterium]|nr:MAG: hypothetical protein DRQ44_06225 [Gammaproteobacteria bacterium]
MPRHWERFSDEIDTKPKFVINVITDMVLRIEKSLPGVVDKLKEVTISPNEKVMIEKIDKKIHTAISKMKARTG